MRPQTISKLLSALFCCVLVAAFVHRDSVRSVNLGKDGYLAQQAHYFDTTLVFNARSPLSSIIGALVLLGFIFAIYELIAFLIAKFMIPQAPAKETQTFGQGF